MTGKRITKAKSAGSTRRTVPKGAWAEDLRKFYGDVLAEPLPESFQDLLRKLDEAADD